VSYCLGRALDFEYPDSVRLYLHHGADPNFRVPWMKNRTHLHRAVESGRSMDILRMLLDAGGDASLPDADGVTPFRTAIRYGREDVVSLLSDHETTEATEEDRALGLMMQGRDEPMTVRADPDMLCAAARRDDTDLIERLIRSGADVNACDSGPHGVPPLHWAAWRGRFAAVRSLVAHGADIHWQNPYGGDALGTAIHGSANCFDAEGGPAMRLPEEALAGDYPQIVEFLISCGARLPDRISGGSETVADILRRHGVPDEVEPSTATRKK
jgi:ankyrin repeat protein